MSVDKPKVILMAPISITANADGTTVDTVLNIPVGKF